MQLRRKFLNWLCDLFLTDYVISQNQVLTWFVYRLHNQRKVTRIMGSTSLLSNDHSLGFTRQLTNLKKCNKVKAYFILWQLNRKTKTGLIYQLHQAKNVIFITDLTALTKN